MRCRGNTDAAIVACTAIIEGGQERRADLVAAYRSRATARLKRRDREGALADYSQAIALDPTIPGLYISRGLVKRALRDLDAAIVDYTKAIDLDPRAATPYVSRGFANAEKGAFDLAIADYGRALERDPAYAFAFADRGVARAGKGDLDGAMADLTRAVAINPHYAFAYTNRGNIERSKGDEAGALADYAHALAADPQFASAYFNRGLLEAAARDLDGAARDFRRTIEIDPSTDVSFQASLYLWMARARTGSRDEATRQLAADVTQRSAEQGDAWPLTVGRFLIGDLNQAALLAAVREPATTLPAMVAARQSQAYFWAGTVRMLNGDTSTALELFRQSMTWDQTPESCYRLAAGAFARLAHRDMSR